MFVQNLKLILDKIDKDLSDLEEVVERKISLINSNKSSDIKPLNQETLSKISNNLDKLDKIIKTLDENS